MAGGAGGGETGDYYGAGADFFGSLVNLFSGITRNRAEAKAQHAQMDYQQMMVNSAHQREVRDLRAAGLNPILSARGAGAGGGDVSPQHLVTPELGEGFRAGAEKVFRDPLQRAEIQLRKNEAEAQSASADKLRSEKKYSDAMTEKVDWEKRVLDSTEKLNQATARNLNQDYYKKEAVGKVYNLGSNVGDWILNEVVPGGQSWFSKKRAEINDWLDKSSYEKNFPNLQKELKGEKPMFQWRAPWQVVPQGDAHGFGAGTSSGGPNRAVPKEVERKPSFPKQSWPDVKKQRGVEDNVFHPKNWR